MSSDYINRFAQILKWGKRAHQHGRTVHVSPTELDTQILTKLLNDARCFNGSIHLELTRQEYDRCFTLIDSAPGGMGVSSSDSGTQARVVDADGCARGRVAGAE